MTVQVQGKGTIVVVQGGQWGSEAKGLITSKLEVDRKADYCVRTGTVNAGHTVYYKGKPYAMQQLPVGWVRRDCTLVLGPGAYIHPEILLRELAWVVAALGLDSISEIRLLVDVRCGLHTQRHQDLALDANRHHLIGATGKGCSEAVVHKISSRGTGAPALFSDWLVENPGSPLHRLHYVDTVHILNRAYDAGRVIVVEGTQGTLLDLHLGPYPYTTHKQTQAASWLAECGLSAALPIEVVSVMRTFPIRVAGNSGPMPGEITWADLAREIGPTLSIRPETVDRWEVALSAVSAQMVDQNVDRNVRLSEASSQAWLRLSEADKEELGRLFERTTVTRKLRRIARWDEGTAKESAMLNRPTSVALTFMNYVFPEAWGATRTTFGNLPYETRKAIYAYVFARQEELGCHISYLGFGPLDTHTFGLYDGEGM